ncbi:MAG: class I SAM-dependent methyltransferase [Nanoarchaeota archaeon]|nr:class I SAM-dependent methyltransferase [Nanoarchaeota archaeon]
MKSKKIIKESYNKCAWNYHRGLSRKFNIWHKYIEKPAIIIFLKGEVKGKKVLDLGCGSGVFSKKLLSFGAKKVKGIDLSEKLIEIAKKENPKVKFYVGDAQKTPFKNSEFDIVTSSLMVHYVKDLTRLFREISRILKKEGLFVFSMHHPIMEVSERLKINGKKSSKNIILKPYFHNKRYKFTIYTPEGGVKLIAYHHTFEGIFNSLNKAGFVVENLLEPTPPKRAENLNKKVYLRSNKRPSFLAIKARKK